MCQLKYVLSPWISRRKIVENRQCCHLVNINWCAAQFPEVQGTDKDRTDFDRDSTHEYILSHVQLAHRCPYYDNIEIERTWDWHYSGSYLPFAVEDLPTARQRYTTSWSWVQERMMAAARAREWRESSAEATTSNNDGHGGEEGITEREETAAPTTPSKSPNGKEGGIGRKVGNGSHGRNWPYWYESLGRSFR